MLTTPFSLKNIPKADVKGPICWGNVLFMIAAVIGIAVKNRYSFGFGEWINQEYFVNPLPIIEEHLITDLPLIPEKISVDFDFPDNCRPNGNFGTEKYFHHCEGLIRHYFKMKNLCEPYKDCVIINYREYEPAAWGYFAKMNYDYFQRALAQFPNKRVIVVTNDIPAAKNTIKEDFEYVDVSPIVDFYYLTQAEYLIMSNSTFSWWGAWLSQAKTVAPENWFAGVFKDRSTKDIYCEDWIIL
jgi:hypothetical protein